MEINHLSEAELRELNRRIVERLKFLAYQKAHEKMLQFKLGQSVQFESRSGPITGIITKYNRKTVSILTPEGDGWNVSPGVLKPARSQSGSKKSRSQPGKVVPIRKKR